MPFKFANRVLVSTATTGTGTVTLGGALAGYQTFEDGGIANTDTVRYLLLDGNAWEIGLGTYTASGTTLSRDAVEESSLPANAKLSLSGGARVGVIASASDYGGKVLQVVEGSTTTLTTIASTTYTDTTLTATITPRSTTSKVWVNVQQVYVLDREAADQYGGIRILRDSTVIHAPVQDATGPFSLAIGSTDQDYLAVGGVFSMTVLDSPNTVSPVVYKTQARPYYTSLNGQITLQPGGGTVVASSTSTITLMEIAG
jgi:hypothetical protein